jgi:hypothetical protein
MLDIIRLQERGDHLIIVDDADLSAVDLEPRTGVSANANPVALFAPRSGPGTKLALVLVRFRADAKDVRHNRGYGLTINKLVWEEQTAIRFLLALVRHHENTPASRLRKAIKQWLFKKRGI